MIVLDTSALIAVVTVEPQAEACFASMKQADRLAISSATLTEAMIVAGRRSKSLELDALFGDLGCEVVDLTQARARAAAKAYALWGKGAHPAKLNLGDCFAYALAQERRAPLLYVGSDFAQTDVASALPAPPPSKPS